MPYINLIPLSELKPHEEVRILRVLLIIAKMYFSKNFSIPLLVDSRTRTILDGHHRFWAAKILNLKRIPCYCVDYLYDNSIVVHTRRLEIEVNKITVLSTALDNKVLPYKTTRHEYAAPAFNPLPLYHLSS